MSTATKLLCLRPADPIALETRRTAMPRPGKGEVLVRVEATSVNPIDVKRAKGYGRRLLSLKGAGKYPLSLGNDFAGEIVSVGAGVSPWLPGDRVMGLVPTGKKGGAHATHLTVNARLVRPTVGGLASNELAAFPYTFTTLWLALRGAGINEGNTKGRNVLVHGASGGLGQLALQVLGAWGASVTAICSKANIDLCRNLGATSVWDRTRGRLDELPDYFDACLNFGAWEDEATLLSRLRQGALGYATTVHPLLSNIDRCGLLLGAWRSRQDWRCMQSLAEAKGAQYRWIIFQPDGNALDMLHQFLTKGALTLSVGVSVPFSDAKLAFEHAAQHKKGRAILLPMEAPAS
ncbi:alcohol dehydrogenase catalytic domain-containing protein [Trinickia sp. YCB016]